MDLKGKRILVTGASRGLGRAIAEMLVEKRAIVSATSRQPETVDWLDGVRLFALDLSTPETLSSSWTQSQLDQERFDIVINNAGSGTFCEFASTAFELWDDQIDLLLRSPAALCRLVLPEMIKRQSGLIVNVSSLGAEYPIPFMNGYCAAKSALSSFSNGLMSELRETRVRVLDFRPGDFNSGFNDSSVRGGFSAERKSVAERAWKIIESRMKESPSPERIAATLVAALESDRKGVLRAGSFFQRVLAPLFARVTPLETQRWANDSYYKINQS